MWNVEGKIKPMQLEAMPLLTYMVSVFLLCILPFLIFTALILLLLCCREGM